MTRPLNSTFNRRFVKNVRHVPEGLVVFEKTLSRPGCISQEGHVADQRRPQILEERLWCQSTGRDKYVSGLVLHLGVHELVDEHE